jgi:hypothetical protein
MIDERSTVIAFPVLVFWLCRCGIIILKQYLHTCQEGIEGYQDNDSCDGRVVVGTRLERGISR